MNSKKIKQLIQINQHSMHDVFTKLSSADVIYETINYTVAYLMYTVILCIILPLFSIKNYATAIAIRF